jgi:hypothetical protein
VSKPVLIKSCLAWLLGVVCRNANLSWIKPSTSGTSEAIVRIPSHRVTLKFVSVDIHGLRLLRKGSLNYGKMMVVSPKGGLSFDHTFPIMPVTPNAQLALLTSNDYDRDLARALYDCHAASFLRKISFTSQSTSWRPQNPRSAYLATRHDSHNVFGPPPQLQCQATGKAFFRRHR